MTKRKAAILGSSGMIGQRFAHMLHDHPYFEVVAHCASDRSRGKTLAEIWKLSDIELNPELAGQTIRGTAVEDLAREGVEVVFSGLPSGVAGDVEHGCAEEGMAVFSNASSHRTDPDTPILIPEINHQHLSSVEIQRKRRKKAGFIVTNANCSVTGLAVGLKPLIDAFGLHQFNVATYQALSGAGYPGVPSVDTLSNILPHIVNEEEKMNSEGRKILGGFEQGQFVDSPVNILASCTRVNVRDGHLEAVFANKPDMPDKESIVSVLDGFSSRPQELSLPSAPEKPVIVRPEPDRPQPLLDSLAGSPKRARGMAVTVGRIRTSADSLRFFLLVHNTIRGGAGGSVLNAELAHREGVL
ncbi:MAG: aspartate-semialdehyde dehydrogenase [Methanobacteriota archaeon]|nr:MAG: aspartate-semialdehyde dehydrogenase [Euryarchaeota archaeon]